MSNVFQTSVILLALFNDPRWYLGYFLLIGLTSFSIITFCFGTAIEYMNDVLYSEVWNINWYFLSNSEQKKVMFLLMVTQNPVIFTIGKFAQSNVHTLLMVITHMGM